MLPPFKLTPSHEPAREGHELIRNLASESLRARGRFLYLGDQKLWVRGVTYGTFRPDEDGNEFGDPDSVARDFAQIASNGMNAVRTYSVPPRWLLDTAWKHGLHVMVGLAWEQHVDFLADRKRVRSIEQKVRAGVRRCFRHPAVLCYAIGNEIPSSIVRWAGPRPIECFLERLFNVVRQEDSSALITYVNYPTTEYLHLPFIDLVTFNVYLEAQERLEAYLARLHNIAGNRPLIMTEIGLDSQRNGERKQALSLKEQIHTSFASGCAGSFVFAWTDEWHRGGYEVYDWDFGLVKRDRSPKPALRSVSEAYSKLPVPQPTSWPRISVLVCSHNGAATLGECLEGLGRVEYPDFEVIVVDDGSKDNTAKIAQQYGFRLIQTENRGLSSARNTGMETATGEILAYIDDDTVPDPHWLIYLARAFKTSDHVAIGGPNIGPEGDGWIADCVDRSPGNPVHILLSDREAEHLPGCNLAIRKSALKAVGGFDPSFRIAGDDVDVCWRLREKGGSLGFAPGAMVWHHRRNSVKKYWKQQTNYGQAEILLQKKWPEKYNSFGHMSWAGRVYQDQARSSLSTRPKIFYGTWGTAPFQSIYEPPSSLLQAMPTMPEWYLVNFALAALVAIGLLWKPLLMVLPLLVLAAGLPLIEVVARVSRNHFRERRPFRLLKLRTMIGFLHILQPLARLCGRLNYICHPWLVNVGSIALPVPRTFSIWRERRQDADQWLTELQETVKAKEHIIVRGGGYDRWDLEVSGGLFGSARLRLALEEHGGGKQLVRFRCWPRSSPTAIALVLLYFSLSVAAMLDQALAAATLLGLAGAFLALSTFVATACSIAPFLEALHDLSCDNSAEALHPTSDSWQNVPKRSIARCAPAASRLADNAERHTSFSGRHRNRRHRIRR